VARLLESKIWCTVIPAQNPRGTRGVILVLDLCVCSYLPFYKYSASFWQASFLHILATPLSSFQTGNLTIFSHIQQGLSLLLLIIGLLMIYRAIATFGFDYITVVYLYFPEESEIQRNEIYSVLRHPTYAGAIIIRLFQ